MPGRVVNGRWREQGGWEWAMWKVLTMFKFNPAGLPSDPTVYHFCGGNIGIGVNNSIV
jgi:hypothetical protein